MTADIDESAAYRKLSVDEQKRADMQSKLHPSVLAVIDRLKAKNAIAGADEGKFIHGGKAELQIWLTDKTPEAIGQAEGTRIRSRARSEDREAGHWPLAN